MQLGWTSWKPGREPLKVRPGHGQLLGWPVHAGQGAGALLRVPVRTSLRALANPAAASDLASELHRAFLLFSLNVLSSSL